MALFLGSKKVAGNTTSESLDSDVKDYKVTFDDSGEVDGITDMDTFMSSFKSKLQLANLFSIIKAGFKIVKDNITNITNTISNLTASDIKATDTEGILGTENTEVISQDLIDAIADKVVNEFVTNTTLTNQLANYVSKSMISTSIENNSSKVSATSLVYQLNSDLLALNSSTLFRYTGSSEPDNKVIRINFTSFNGLMGMIFYSIPAFLMINVDLSQSRTLSGLQQSPIKFTFLNGTIQNSEEIIISIIYNDDDNFQIKLEFPQRIPALYLVPICSNFENVSITSTVS